MPIRASIRAGACGFEAVVHATCSDGLWVTLQLESNCPKVQEMAAALHDLNALDEVLRRPLVDTTPAQIAAQYGLHASCPIPVGILKVVEAAAGLALPARSEILVEKAT
ncbi:MAG TPA: hypothetical protein VM366_20830 [Anaerolineae bacterium]|nr:hypothetical protein [Anaerolineae bacterium]